MDVLKFFTVRLCPWDMHLTGRRRRSLMFRSFAGSISMSDIFFHLSDTGERLAQYICTYEMIWVKPAYEKCSHSDMTFDV